MARRDLDQQGSLTLTLKFKFFSSQGKNFHYFSNSSQGLKSWKNQGYFKGNPWNPLNFKARLIKECWLQVKGWVVEIPKNPWKSLKILENPRKSLKIFKNPWKSLIKFESTLKKNQNSLKILENFQVVKIEIFKGVCKVQPWRTSNFQGKDKVRVSRNLICISRFER